MADPNPSRAAPLVLIVEDFSLNALLIRMVLEKVFPGIGFCEAHDGNEAVEMYARFSPDLVLMDIQMPEKDGFAATREIRDQEAARGSRVPIIALTAGMKTDDRERCLDAGMDDYLVKPFDRGALVETVRRHLPRGEG